MNVLIINLILTTAEKGVITRRKSIADTMISCLARGFVKLGHQVTLLASEDFKPTKPESHEFNIIYFKSLLPCIFKPALLPWPKGLHSYLNKNIKNFDIVVSSEAFSLGTLIASYTCGKKLMVWQEMAYHQKLFHKIPSKLWHNVIALKLLRHNLIIPRSKPAQDFIKKYAQHVSNELVDNPADPQVLYPSHHSTHSMIVVSQLIKRKNVDKIIDIFGRFVNKPKFNDYLLHIIGDGKERDNLLRIIKENHLEQNVLLHGFLPHHELNSYLRSAKALLVKTSMDLNMVTIPEAIVSGTPVVMNTVPTTASFVANNHLGLVDDNWDENTLAKLIEDYDSMHEACIKARDSLTNVGCAKKMIEIFDNFINPHTSPNQNIT